MRKIDLTGQKFGRLMVVSESGKSKSGNYTWLCKCDCGNMKIVDSGKLRSGNTKSCGCLHHRQCGSRTYSTWQKIIQRCRNKNVCEYPDYGGRGIKVCDRWLIFENFYADMGERPKEKTIERTNNDKGYSPENCKWATRKEQQRNRRNNLMIKYHNQNLCLSEWCEQLSLNYKAAWRRLRVLNWSVERTFGV